MPLPNQSRFATLDANPAQTPTPSSRRSGRRGGRRATSTTHINAAATPTSTDYALASSEGCEGYDADDARPTIVWGTNISVEDVNEAIYQFLKHFRDSSTASQSEDWLLREGKYEIAIKRVIEIAGESLDVNARDVFDYDPDGACRKQRLPMRFGRRQSDSSVSLIKVSTSTPSTNRTMTKERKKELRVDILIVSITLVAFACIVLVISGFVIYRSHVSKHENVSNMGKFVDEEDVGPRSFTYAELEKITDGFKEELGRGAFGIVYKGMRGNGQKIVAVKRLEKLLADREREFQTEMKVIGKTHHRNLIRLLG